MTISRTIRPISSKIGAHSPDIRILHQKMKLRVCESAFTTTQYERPQRLTTTPVPYSVSQNALFAGRHTILNTASGHSVPKIQLGSAATSTTNGDRP
jgi:hypothetical protein